MSGTVLAGVATCGQFAGIPFATLQQWLIDTQTVLQKVASGERVQSVSYSQGDGARSVTYGPADAGALRERVMELQMALGLHQRRRPIRPYF